MGEAYLDWQKKSGGIKLNDVIEDYKYVAAGERVKSGDLLTYVEGATGEEIEVAKAGNVFPSNSDEWNERTAGTTRTTSTTGYILESSSTDSSSYLFRICNSQPSNPWDSDTGSLSQWVILTCPKPEKITKMKIYVTAYSNESRFGSAIIQGSKDGNTWVDLHTISSYQTELTEITLENVDYYKYYKVSGTLNNTSARLRIYQWQTSEYIDKSAGTEMQVTPATEPPFNAIALSSGVGGTDTAHKDQVKIARVANKLSMLPVGALVKDVNSTFLGQPVIWKIADKNHEGYPDGSVTLITERSIALRAFDAKEPNNSNSDRQSYGNNRYSVSNIRQWLNSDAGAGQWYSAQHDADQAPSAGYVSANAYSDKAGFLNAFSQQFKNALLETNLTVALNTVTDDGGSETVKDKVFLASSTEVGFENENNIVEGTLLPIFSDNASRITYSTTEAIEDSDYGSDPANDTTAWYWLLRTPVTGKSGQYYYVNTSGARYNDVTYNGTRGVRPLCNIPSSIRVSEEPDADGCYTLFAGGEA